jgi:hypothetical protein
MGSRSPSPLTSCQPAQSLNCAAFTQEFARRAKKSRERVNLGVGEKLRRSAESSALKLSSSEGGGSAALCTWVVFPNSKKFCEVSTIYPTTCATFRLVSDY